ncbi:hypothetical protein [Alistipes sp. ZOR0009]|uniref:hypothetical protein n=1 Tax=Alistipes sp. ZOR0009 TaxID=1339253 RepID=UPI0006485C13|nr:hypothetical protein [Alistipes sp. ZOR0009]
MPKKLFHLKNESLDAYVVSWNTKWEQTQVFFNDTLIGVVNGKEELKKGKSFEIEDFKTLTVKLTGGLIPELVLLINGKYIDGSPTDPALELKNVYNLIFTLSSLSIIVGVIVEIFQIDFLLNVGIGLGSIIYGLILFGLGYGVSKRLKGALILTFVVIILSIVLTLMAVKNSHTNPSSGITIKLFFLYYMFKGFAAIKKIKETTTYSE